MVAVGSTTDSGSHPQFRPLIWAKRTSISGGWRSAFSQEATFRLRVRPRLWRDFGRLLWLVFLNDQASRGISLDLVTAFANAKAKCCFWTNAVAPDIVQV